MSANRTQSFLSILQWVNCPVVYLNARNLRQWQHPEHPFHPAFDFLSATHKSDYLRGYLMHHYGGGYTDIKPTHKDWSPFFSALRATDKLALGYTEIGPEGVAPVGGELEQQLRAEYRRLVGLCAFIFRRRSVLTAQWYAATAALLDAKLDLLRQNPATHPQEFQGVRFDDGSVSAYPVAWTELLGNIFHPLVWRHRDSILHADIAPRFENYR